MGELVLIRGLPGSGKTTIAKAMAGYSHYEADQYFSRVDGEYRFDPAQLKDAHQWCQDCVDDELADGQNVVVANTFSQRWEMQPYMNMAKRMGIKVRVITAKGRFESIHGVPAEKIEAMRQRWEEF